jgi:hypothetical protein
MDHAIEVFRTGNVTILLAEAVASVAWMLAQLGGESEARGRLRDGEQLLERQGRGSGRITI